MSNLFRSANVYVKNILAGQLKEVKEGYIFKYYESYLNSINPFQVSIALPLRKQEFFSTILFSFLVV